MERLTNQYWRNFDPWECCGQDHFCTRGCHDLGGCTGGCIVPKLYAQLGEYEDTGLAPETVSDLLERLHSLYEIFDDLDLVDRVHFQAFLERVRRWRQAEKDGRLAVLPCKAGDVVYEENKRGFISTYKVISIHLSDCSMLIGWELIDGIYSSLNGFEASALGKTVFLTREEAEAALKKREAGNEID